MHHEMVPRQAEVPQNGSGKLNGLARPGAIWQNLSPAESLVTSS
jgi:hypothetical protein